MTPIPSASLGPAPQPGLGQVGAGPTGPVGPAPATRITASGRIIHSIGTGIDAAYTDLYASITGRNDIDWAAYSGAVAAFIRTRPTSGAADHFFENATPVWLELAASGKYEEADEFWRNVLSAVTQAETVVGFKIHKGSGYYFWACNELRRGDLDRGLLLMHEALVEDVRTHQPKPGSWPKGAASMVISLDVASLDTHPAEWWVQEQIASIDTPLSKGGAALRAADLRGRLFLVTPPSDVFLFVHANASLVRLAAIDQDHRDNDFVARLALGHLFHIAIVVERIVKARSGGNGLFANQVQALSHKIGGQLSHQISRKVKKPRITDIGRQAKDAGGLLRRLLAGTATCGGAPVLAVDQSLCIGYVLRNLGAHESSAPSLIATEVETLRSHMLSLLANAVVAYY